MSEKRAEEALRESERELRQLIDSVPAMIAVANSQGRSVILNKRAIDYLDTTMEEFGERPMKIVHPEHQELLRSEWLRCQALGQRMDLDHRVLRFDGVYRWSTSGPSLSSTIERDSALVLCVYGHRRSEDRRGNASADADALSRATQAATVGELAPLSRTKVNQAIASVVTNAQRGSNVAVPRSAESREGSGDPRSGSFGTGIPPPTSCGEFVRSSRRRRQSKALLDMNLIIAEVLACSRTNFVTAPSSLKRT